MEGDRGGRRSGSSARQALGRPSVHPHARLYAAGSLHLCFPTTCEGMNEGSTAFQLTFECVLLAGLVEEHCTRADDGLVNLVYVEWLLQMMVRSARSEILYMLPVPSVTQSVGKYSLKSAQVTLLTSS